MRNHTLYIWIFLALLFCASGASAQKISAEKVLDKGSIDAGNPVVISLRITNPFDSPVNVRIVDKNIFANNGLDIQCLEYAVPNRTTVEAAYPEIIPYTGGNYVLDPASLTYTSPDTGKDETITTNAVNVSVKDKQGGAQGTAQGVTSVYRCGGMNMQTTSYSYSSPQNQQQQNEEQQNQQARVQNNQMDQNANALKQEIEKQQADQKSMQEAFQKNLENNSDYQKQDQAMQKQGYKPSDSKNDPISNDSGKFRKDYKKDNGENASLQGVMKNGSIQNMQAQSSEDIKQALSALQQDPSYQQYDKQLTELGYNASNAQVQQTGPNNSKITVPYNNGSISKNITAEYVNGTIKNVEIDEKADNQNNVIWIAAAFVLMAVFAYFLYRRYSKKRAVVRECAPVAPASIDYRSEAKKMLAEAENLFSRAREKDAYEKVSQTVRFYYSNDLGERKDISNTELLDLLKKKRNERYQEAQKCLTLCGLVEFAKYNANKEDFSQIIEIARDIIA
jgi:hypothetical protein